MRNFIVLVSFCAMAACTAAEVDDGDVGDTEDLKASSSAISASCRHSRANILASVSGARRTAIERGFTWLDAKVPYSQKASHGGYRTDCSGFVSMCWSLGTSLTTGDFASGGGGTRKLASYDNLQPGDALLRRQNGEGHIMLFLGWNDDAHAGACVLEQASTASDMQFRVRATSSLKSQAYKAIVESKLASSPSVPSAPTAAPAGGDDDDDDATATQPANTGTAAAGGGTCVSDGACNPGNDGAGLICVRGQCVPGCHSNAQCAGATSCISGQCR
jgi:hypothetical protein